MINPLSVLETNFGSGLFFFLLDVVVIVLFLPIAIAWRQRSVARKNWQSVARNLAGDVLALSRVTNGKPDADFDYMLGYAEAAQNAIIIMGRDLHAFRDLSLAILDLTPPLMRVRRRLALITAAGATAVNRRPEQMNLLENNAAELAKVVKLHEKILLAAARGYQPQPPQPRRQDLS